jgi:hypothetical protein
MPLSFPGSPSNGDTYTYANRTYQYDGTKWIVITGPTTIAAGSITTDKLASVSVTSAKIASGALDPSTIAVTGGTPSTIQFDVLGNVDAGGV